LTQAIIKQIERTPCPSCGCNSLKGYNDPIGITAQCYEHDCLAFFELDELGLEETA
jgi:hypothetical protein